MKLKIAALIDHLKKFSSRKATESWFNNPQKEQEVRVRLCDDEGTVLGHIAYIQQDSDDGNINLYVERRSK
jgi:hypothetical protein